MKQAYEEYRVSASTLRRIIDRDHGMRINHDRIHRILVELEYAKPLNKQHKRKKNWIRYERRHNLTAVRIDWYFDSKNEVLVFAIIDDASRKMLALLEVESATTDWSIEGIELALRHGR
ncbi:hypothetical protein COV93_07395 [Candidatus Woesearchaeota archaeon CG11_big_fil_rev_8_21_14_0_20_43_8]|nr:MAG: hypothetical protein COV93_07395 [Candidatus Woesearchaeota archaeon CG11_big_fil_rev_8_21_14_0_20_43_8]PIO06809.1 MAG: hypothetical protein COT47_02595 [Candidatus Woesearchaeota archaeon CG08_land_8_20_14_0_20_43_7]